MYIPLSTLSRLLNAADKILSDSARARSCLCVEPLHNSDKSLSVRFDLAVNENDILIDFDPTGCSHSPLAVEVGLLFMGVDDIVGISEGSVVGCTDRSNAFVGDVVGFLVGIGVAGGESNFDVGLIVGSFVTSSHDVDGSEDGA